MNQINQSIKNTSMKSFIKANIPMSRVKRAMAGKFPEEKKKIWQKTVSQETRERLKSKKMWQRERAVARTAPIFEEQNFIEMESAQSEINDWMNQYYSCSCDVEDPYDYMICYCDDCGGPPSKYCYNCEGRLYQMYHHKKKEPKIIKEKITQVHPWGKVTIPVEYIVPPIPENVLKEYENDMKRAYYY